MGAVASLDFFLDIGQSDKVFFIMRAHTGSLLQAAISASYGLLKAVVETPLRSSKVAMVEKLQCQLGAIVGDSELPII